MKPKPNFHLIRTVLLWIFLLFLNIPLQAQMDSLLFLENSKINENDTRKLSFCLDNLNFIKNNENKGCFTKGYTLPGLWLLPRFSYQPLKNLKVEAGLYMLRFWGSEAYPNFNYSDIATWKGEDYQHGFHAIPYFRVHYAVTPHFNIVMGHIYGRNNHQLIEPLYNPEMGLTADPESGLQLLWHTRPADVDMWVNWESFIFQNDNHQESFTYGLATRFKLNAPQSKIHVYMPLQALYQHRGGEINTEATDRSVKTWLNAAAGYGMDFHLRNRYFKKLNLEADFVYFAQQKGQLIPFDKGYGLHGKLTADIYRFRIHAGYWQCHNFATIFGNPLFGAISTYDKSVQYRDPKMLYFRLEYAQPIGKGFYWGIHTDVYNNFPADAYNATDGWHREPNAISFLAGIYLRLNMNFLIKQFGK